MDIMVTQQLELPVVAILVFVVVLFIAICFVRIYSFCGCCCCCQKRLRLRNDSELVTSTVTCHDARHCCSIMESQDHMQDVMNEDDDEDDDNEEDDVMDNGNDEIRCVNETDYTDCESDDGAVDPRPTYRFRSYSEPAYYREQGHSNNGQPHPEGQGCFKGEGHNQIEGNNVQLEGKSTGKNKSILGITNDQVVHTNNRSKTGASTTQAVILERNIQANDPRKTAFDTQDFSEQRPLNADFTMHEQNPKINQAFCGEMEESEYYIPVSKEENYSVLSTSNDTVHSSDTSVEYNVEGTHDVLRENREQCYGTRCNKGRIVSVGYSPSEDTRDDISSTL